MEKECLSCLGKFNTNLGHGGQNRSFCFDCFPSGLTKAERGVLRAALLRARAGREKVKMGCSKCGYNKFAGALEWHHHNDDKQYEPSNLIKRSWDAYQLEVQKCKLLCSNCHREEHAGII